MRTVTRIFLLLALLLPVRAGAQLAPRWKNGNTFLGFPTVVQCSAASCSMSGGTLTLGGGSSTGNWSFSANDATTSGSPTTLRGGVLSLTATAISLGVSGSSSAPALVIGGATAGIYSTGATNIHIQSGNGTANLNLDGENAAFNAPAGGASLILFGSGAVQLGGATLTIANLLTGGIPCTVGSPIFAAATIAPTKPITHITGHTAAIVTITAPAEFAVSGGGGSITLIFDDALTTWTSGGNIAVAGSATTAGSMVIFVYDNATSKWYPSRVADLLFRPANENGWEIQHYLDRRRLAA